MLKTIEQLREQVKRVANNSLIAEITVDVMESWCADIQEEVESKYMLLPVDADGVPTHMGDTVEGELPGNTIVKGVVTTYHIHDNDEPDTVYIKVDCGGGAWTIKELTVKHCRHVKPRTVEDVLREFVDVYANSAWIEFDPKCVSRYADELRAMLGGGTND